MQELHATRIHASIVRRRSKHMKAYLYLIGILVLTLIIALINANDKINELQHEVEKWERVLNS